MGRPAADGATGSTLIGAPAALDQRSGCRCHSAAGCAGGRGCCSSNSSTIASPCVRGAEQPAFHSNQSPRTFQLHYDRRFQVVWAPSTLLVPGARAGARYQQVPGTAGTSTQLLEKRLPSPSSCLSAAAQTFLYYSSSAAAQQGSIIHLHCSCVGLVGLVC